MTHYRKNSTSPKLDSTCSSGRISSGSFHLTKDFSLHQETRTSLVKELAKQSRNLDSKEKLDVDEFAVPDEESTIQNKKIAFPSIHNGNNHKYVKVENFVHRLNFISFTDDDILTRYDVVGGIGKGGCGEVVKAIFKPTGEIRAIKTVPAVCNDKKKLTKRLEDEGYMMTDIDHPNIIKLFELNRTEDDCSLVLEFLDGGILLDYYKNENIMTLQNIANITSQLLSAIDYLHRNKISHRDIKLENIILLEKQSGPFVKLIDFGISTKIEPNSKFARSAGSPVYMAPEAFLGPYDKKCDLWSLGVVLFILLLKEIPFKGSSLPEIRNKIVSQEIDWNAPKIRNADAACVDLLKKLLEKNPEKRISARDALNERFITKYCPELNPNSNLLREVKSFGEDGALKTILHAFEIYQVIPSNDKDELVDLFRALDKEKLGHLTIKDIVDALKNDGADDDDIKKVLKNNQYDEKKIITFSEFLVSNYSLLKLNSKWHKKLFSILNESLDSTDFLRNLQYILEINVKNININSLIKKILQDKDSSTFSQEDLAKYL